MARRASQPFRAAFDRTARLSQYVARVAHARPGVVAELERREARPFSREEIHASLADGSAGDIAVRLRRVRERVFVSLAHRDLNGLASLDEVFATMDALAEECIGAARARAGAQITIAALGKLGGGELN